MGAANLETAAGRFAEHLVDGWKLVGHYLKKWFLYNVYALAIYLLFVLWLMLAAFVGGGFEAVAPGTGFVAGAAVFVLAPAVAAYVRDSPDEPEESEAAETA